MENQEVKIGIGKIPSFFKTLETKSSSFPRQQRQLAQFVLRNPIRAAFLNTDQLSKEAGVSAATVVRFTTSMGYQKFRDFQKELQQTTQEVLEGRAVLEVDPQKSDESLLTSISVAQKSLKEFEETRNEAEYKKAVDLIFAARKVAVVGHKASLGVAAHCAYVLSKVHADVFHVLDTNTFDSFSRIDDLGEEDVAVVFTVIHYPTATLNLMRMLAKRGVKIVLVSDYRSFAEASLASVSILIPLFFVGCFDVTTPMLVLADALAYGVLRRDEEKAKERLLRFNRFNEEDNAFRQICRFAD